MRPHGFLQRSFIKDPHRLHSLRLANACAEGKMYEPSSASTPARFAARGAAKSVAELCESSTKLLQRPVVGKAKMKLNLTCLHVLRKARQCQVQGSFHAFCALHVQRFPF